MKFNKFNILHVFIYFYGWILFNFIFLYKKSSSREVKTRVILYGHKLYGNLKSLYKELDETDEFGECSTNNLKIESMVSNLKGIKMGSSDDYDLDF